MSENDPNKHDPPPLPQWDYRAESAPPIVLPFIGGAIVTGVPVGFITGLSLLAPTISNSNASPAVTFVARILLVFGAIFLLATIFWLVKGDRKRPFFLGLIAGVWLALLLAGICFGGP